jgi:hypothetical protein
MSDTANLNQEKLNALANLTIYKKHDFKNPLTAYYEITFKN